VSCHMGDVSVFLFRLRVYEQGFEIMRLIKFNFENSK
jgi:hypothetical protein